MEKKKILLVEDDLTSVEVIEKYLSGLYSVVTALNGPEAILKARNEIFNLVLLDIQLPLGMSGIKVLKELRQINDYENIPIIAQTAYAMNGDEQKLLEEGFDAYISKPFMKSDLLKVINGIMK